MVTFLMVQSNIQPHRQAVNRDDLANEEQGLVEYHAPSMLKASFVYFETRVGSNLH
jgi:hypothetical protein